METGIQPSHARQERKPSTAFLVVLNGLLFLAMLLSGANLVGVIFAIPATMMFMAMSGVWQVIWVFLDRRFRFHNILRCIGFILPAVALVVLPLLGIGPPHAVNKQRPAISLSGTYKAYVLAEPEGWTVKIEDQTGTTLHEESTDCVSHLNVYWIWGPSERLWLYNSDDGGVYCWYAEPNGEWRHVLWGYGHAQETDVALGVPPEDLYPDYACQRTDATGQPDEPEPE